MKRSMLHAAAVGAALLGLSMTGMAAGFGPGPYAPSSWALANDANDTGSVDTSGAPASIMLIGSNNSTFDDTVNPPVCNSGACANTFVRYTTTAQAAGMVSFSWAYATQDATGPFFDQVGYVLNGADLQLSDDNGSVTQGAAMFFRVAQGDQFGYFVHTLDNAYGAAKLTISDFSAPVPEPASTALMALGLLGLAGVTAARRRSHR